MNLEKFSRFPLPPVNLESTNLADEWKHWLDAFQNYRIATKLNKEEDAVQRASILHLAGPAVQRLLTGLAGVKDKYDDVVKVLTEHFQPKRHKWAERYKFRKRHQEQNETLDTFIAELRVLANSCAFDNEVDDNILGQVIEKCADSYLRQKLLQQGDGLNLQKAQALGRAIEQSKKDAGLLGGQCEKSHSSAEKAEINQVQKTDSKPPYQRTRRCYRCGSADHLANEARCRAREVECNKCKKIGHLEKCCRLKAYGRQGTNVRSVGEEQPLQATEGYEHEYVCLTKSEGSVDFTIDTEINGKPLQMIIDTGCSRTLIPKEWFKAEINSPLTESKVKFTVFGGGKIKCLGTFDGRIKCNGQEVTEKVFVVDVDGPPLLGRSAIQALNLIKIYAVGEGQCNQKEVILQDYADVFSEELGEFKGYEYEILVNKDVPPKAQRQRPIPAMVESKLKAEIERMLKEEVIEEATGTSWISPVHIVYKGNGELRICVDLREVNKAVIRERFPIPRIQDILRQLNGAQLFTTLDLRKAYWQLRLSDESREITSFMAAGKVYQFKRLPFGLASAPEAYQRMMMMLCEGMPGVLNYFDDVVVYGSTPEEHWSNVKKMLQKLREAGLKLNAKKCVMGMSELKFLGHIISAEGIRPDPEKVKAITEAPVPQNVGELRSFLGGITYLTQFVPNLATVLAPLRKLIQKGVHWKWTVRETVAYKHVKELLTKAPCLAHYSMEAETKLVVDASPYGLGAVLLQRIGNEMRPVAYASRTLTEVERRYAQIEREALAVLVGLQKMHTYVYGRHITVATDHKPLLSVFTKPTQSIRLERVAMRAQDYDFTLTYEPGAGNVADGWSRLPSEATEGAVKFIEEHVRFAARDIELLTLQEICDEGKEDVELQNVVKAINNGWRNTEDELKKWQHLSDELSYAQGLLWRGRRIFVPSKLRKKALNLAHAAHQGIVRSKQRLRASLFWPGMDAEIERFCHNCETCVRLQPLSRDTPLQTTPLPEQCWEKCGIDLVGPFPGQIYILTLVDYRSKWPEAVILTKITSQQIIKELTEVFARFGNPKLLVTDNGRQFISEEFEGFLRSNGITHARASPYYPQANGQVERFHRYLKHSLRAAELDGVSWIEALPGILQVYRATPHAGTGQTPAKMMLNREIVTKLPIVQDKEEEFNIEKRYERYQKKMCEYANEKRGAKQHDLSVGDVVFVASMTSSKLSARYSEDRYVILRKKGIDTFEVVQVDTGKVYIRNAKFLTKVPPKRDWQFDDSVVDCGVRAETAEKADTVVTPTADVSEVPGNEAAETPSLNELIGTRQENVELRRSTRVPKPNRNSDYVYL